MRVLLVLALFFYQDNPSPFSKDYKGGGGGKGGPAPKKGAASASSKKPGNTAAVLKSAVEWLLKNQQKDGSWDTRLGGETGTIVVTSWCGLALMATGQHTEAWTKAAKYVAAKIHNKSHNPDPKWDQTNWQVSIGGMFLAEYVAETKDAEVKAVLEKVAEEIGRRMEPSGGYGHCKGVKNALNYLELEVMSNWMMAAAGMCRRLNVKGSADMGRAMTFVENCCSPGGGNVGYSPGPGQKGVGCPCRTGGAIFAFALLKAQSNGLYARMAEYYKKAIDKSNEGHGSLAMGLLESALGARTLGSDVWDAYVSKFFPQILSHANSDGSFKHITGKTMQSIGGDNMTGPAYPTGIFALILQLDLGNLTFVGQKNN